MKYALIGWDTWLNNNDVIRRPETDGRYSMAWTTAYDYKHDCFHVSFFLNEDEILLGLIPIGIPHSKKQLIEAKWEIQIGA